jgi:hypothetical protein
MRGNEPNRRLRQAPSQPYTRLGSVVKRIRIPPYSTIRSYTSERKSLFPSTLRNLIMESAADLTLMELTYDNRTRLVEPYSLVFKRRSSDGVGQEYFYAFDRTGGHTSSPGLKSFFHHKIQNIQKTNTRFEPRFPVELSKAGEFAGRTYFGSPFGRSVHRRVARALSPIARIYIVECSYCAKRFPRKKYSTRLRPHKDRYGKLCYGRSGFIAY